MEATNVVGRITQQSPPPTVPAPADSRMDDRLASLTTSGQTRLSFLAVLLLGVSSTRGPQWNEEPLRTGIIGLD